MNRQLRPLGDRLRDLRERHYMTQQNVADAMNVSINSYRNYEYGSIIPKARELISLADLYDMTVDDILGIGTEMHFRYDAKDLSALRKAVKTTDAVAIGSALAALLSEHRAAFDAPNLTRRQMEIYANSTIRTVSYNETDEQLVYYAQDRLSQLRYMKRIIHDGYYYALDIPEQLARVRNPFYSDMYSDADIFRQDKSSVFARVLSRRFGYGVYFMETGEDTYIFCKKGEKYIDIRGWTEDYMEFTAGWPDYRKEPMQPYDDSGSNPEGEKFAEWIIDRNPQYYDV